MERNLAVAVPGNRRRFEHLQAGSLGLLLMVLPLAHVPAVQLVLAGCCLLLFVIGLFRGDAYFSAELPAGLKWALAAWLLTTMLSCLWSIDPLRSLSGVLMGVWAPAGIFLFALKLGDDPALLRRALSGFSAGFVLLCLVCLIGLLKGGMFLVSQGVSDALSSDFWVRWYPGPGLASSFVLISLPLSWWIWRDRLRPAGGGILLALLVVGMLSLNRMFWIGLAVMAIVGGATSRFARTRDFLSGHRMKLLLMGACLLVGVSLLGATMLRDGEAGLDAKSLVQASRKLVKDPRWEIWQNWLNAGLERPLLGTGYGKEVARRVYRDDFLPIAPDQMDPAGKSHPHNLFLSLWIQTGVPGLAAFLFLLGALFRFAAINVSTVGERTNAAAALSMLTAMLFFKNLTDDFYDVALPLMFWAYAGLMVGAMNRKVSV